MIVQHNITAMNANRMLGLTTGSLAKSTEKLSSGYRINRAADDAAGLSISEKMRKQIRGLSQASTNAEDGISCVQTAEGALNEIHSMLQRMNELAVQSANGTNSESDRTAIQNEIDQLSTEIDRVSETTKYNETYLLKGDKSLDKQHTYSYKKFNAAQAGSATEATGTSKLKMKFEGATDGGATQKLQDETNDFLISLRDSGVKVGASYDDNAAAVVYSLSLTGAAADKYTVSVTAAMAGTFAILDKENKSLGTITVGGAADAGVKKSGDSAFDTIISTTITAAESKSAQAKYYDKDGNAIPANALSNYMTMNADGKAVSQRGDSPQAYDAVGNKKKIAAEKIIELADQEEMQGKRVGIISCEEHKNWYLEHLKKESHPLEILKIAGSLKQEETIAHNLYRILREFDEEKAEVIFSEVFETPTMGTAIMNRLRKAAGQKIIKC